MQEKQASTVAAQVSATAEPAAQSVACTLAAEIPGLL
jgi:hypothetical protein